MPLTPGRRVQITQISARTGGTLTRQPAGAERILHLARPQSCHRW